MSERIAGSDPAPENLRDAYLRRNPDAESDLERHLLLRGMGLRSRMLFRILGGFRPHSFNPDRALVESLASIRNLDDLESRLEEFHDLNRIDRSFRRRILGVRVSQVRLRRILEPLFAEIAAPSSVGKSSTTENRPSGRGDGVGAVPGTLRPADLGSVGRGLRGAPQEASDRAKELEAEIEMLRRRMEELGAELERIRR